MAYEDTVLSLNLEGPELLRYDSALRKRGFHIMSVSSPLQARFEIEMGRCGIFLTSYITPPPIYLDLAGLFRVSCPDGVIAYIGRDREESAPHADVVLLDGDDPEMLVRQLRQKRTKAN